MEQSTLSKNYIFGICYKENCVKKIILIIFVAVSSYATGDMIVALHSTFRKNINEYYKLWAVGYCMGHFKVENNIKFGYQETPARFNRDDFKIDKIVYLLGIEPLNELKAYIDKGKSYFDKDRANYCLGLLVPNETEGYHSLNDEAERIVKKYCKDCE